MKYFFEDPEKCEILQEELKTWLRTPFKHHLGIKGMGCDCAHFVLRVFECPKLEALQSGRIKVPDYPKDWHLHQSNDLIYNKMKSLSFFEELEMVDGFPVCGVMDGDIYMHKYGNANAHSGIYCKDVFYHAINGVGVQDTDWHDINWSRKRTCGFRMLAK